MSDTFMMGFPARELPPHTHRVLFESVQLVENPAALPDGPMFKPPPVKTKIVPLELTPSGNIRMGFHEGTLYFSRTGLGVEWTRDDMLMALTTTRQYFEESP